MARIPSTASVLKTLRAAGFPMAAIVEQSRGRIEIGYIDAAEGIVQLADRERTYQAATVAEELLGWGGYGTGYGTWILRASNGADDCSRQLAQQNID
jgi:hypothetical protein